MVTRKLGAVWLLLLLIVCGGEPTSPPTEIVTKEGLRFRAAAFRGDDDIGVVLPEHAEREGATELTEEVPGKLEDRGSAPEGGR